MASPAQIADLGRGVHRITHALPWALHHVHTYAVEGGDGWTLIDTGLGDADSLARWQEALRALGSPRVAQLVVTHHHPDHVGAGAALAAWSGAEVVQGRIDAAVAASVWRRPAELVEFEAHLASNGMPEAAIAAVMTERRRLPVDPAEPDRLVDAGDVVALGGEPFQVVWLPGHADGHIVLVAERSGRMFGGDVLLHKITPNIGVWVGGAPDPLGAYLTTLSRLAELAPGIVYPGHHGPISDVAARAEEIRRHHVARLDLTRQAVRDGAGTTYEVALRLFGARLGAHEQRFAIAEALAHLEHLQVAGALERGDDRAWREAA